MPAETGSAISVGSAPDHGLLAADAPSEFSRLTGVKPAKDAFSLPPSNPCHDAVEAFKGQVAPQLENLYHSFKFQEFERDINHWLPCCPEFREVVNQLRPAEEKQANAESFELSYNITDTACSRYLPREMFESASHSLGKQWMEARQQQLFTDWEKIFESLTDGLKTCCEQKSSLQSARQQCVQNLAGCRDNHAFALQAQADTCERQQQQAIQDLQAAQAKQQDKLLGNIQGCDATLDMIEKDRGQLRAAVTELTPHSGAEVLAAFPEGAGSAELVWLGGAALLGGFFLRMPGRSGRRGKLAAGFVAGLVALAVYLGAVYLLPDSRLPFLCVAVMVALFLVALRTLLRCLLLLRHGRAAGYTP